jgi:UDP-N-acetylmuramate-alanine ligase
VPKQDLSSYVGRIARAGDTIFFLGAGDIGEISHVVAERLHST